MIIIMTDIDSHQVLTFNNFFPSCKELEQVCLYIILRKDSAQKTCSLSAKTGELYHEELFGTEGFSSTSSLVYHLRPPTRVRQIGKPWSIKPELAIEDNLQALSFSGFKATPKADYIESRRTLFLNADMSVSLAAPTESLRDYFFKNADADEMIFIHEGAGVLRTSYGNVRFEYGDYLVIPRGTVYQIEFDSGLNRHLIVESHGPIRTPGRYRNNMGQYLEHSLL